MSGVESAQQAARLTDPIGHGLGLLGIVAGAIIGAVVGALLIAGAIATGGTLLIALAACAAVACVAGAGLAGGQLARGIQTAAGLSHPVTGAIGTVGSPNVRIGMLPAARAVADMAAGCHGLYTLNHFPMPPLPLPPIAEGSATVLFNSLPAARVSSKLVCAAEITLGCPTVIIGGPTVRMLDVIDVEAMLETGLTYLLWGSLIAAFLLTIPFGAAAVAEFVLVFAGFLIVFEGLGQLGDYLGPGYRDILQGAAGILAVVGGGMLARRGMARAPQGRRGIPPEQMRRIQNRARRNQQAERPVEEVQIIRDPNPDSLPYHGRSTPEGGRYLPKDPERVPGGLRTARDGPNRGMIVNEDGTPYVDGQGNRYYSDMDLQGVYRRNAEGEWVSEPTNDPAWQDRYNREIAPDRTGRERPVQHGANDNYRRSDGSMRRQPDPNETYTVVEPDGTARQINSTAELQQYYRRNGIDWPYRDYQ